MLKGFWEFFLTISKFIINLGAFSPTPPPPIIFFPIFKHIYEIITIVMNLRMAKSMKSRNALGKKKWMGMFNI